MKKRITFHEAGHVIADIILGLPFEAVSVETKRVHREHFEDGRMVDYLYKETEGVVMGAERLDKTNADIRAGKLDLREAISCMAGPQAEAKIVGEVDDEVIQGATTDIQGITACCRIAAYPDMPIESCPPSEMEDLICDAVAEQAKILLQENWTAVEAVANALNDRKKLSYAEVQAIVNKTKEENKTT